MGLLRKIAFINKTQGGNQTHVSKLIVLRSAIKLLGIITKNRNHKLDAALRIELRLQATRQTTKPSQPRFN